MLVVEATSERIVCATVRWSEQAGIGADEDLVGPLDDSGILALTLQPKDDEQWQGTVPPEGSSVAHMLMSYIKRSEQLDTHITLSASGDACGDLLVQRLSEEETDGDAWVHIDTLAQTTTTEELASLDAYHLLYRLFHETPPRVFELEQIEFSRICPYGKVDDMLPMFSAAEIGGVVAEQGGIEVDCDFYRAKCMFDETDAGALLGVDIVDTARQEIHRLQ